MTPTVRPHTDGVNEIYTVGYDGSAQSQRAVMWAAGRAALTGARVEVVGCYTVPLVISPWMPTIPVDERTIEEATAADVRVSVEIAREQYPDVEFLERVVHGAPRTALVEAAADSSLLVVGSTGAGATEAWLLGSVAQAVVRSSPCPVVVVREVDADLAARPRGRIVVGVDGSATSSRALTWAVDEADRRDAELVIVHAWDYPYGKELSAQAVHDLIKVDAALVLEEAVRYARERGRSPVRGELVHGVPSQALLEHAADADLVVVGSRGRGGFRAMLFGSVALAVTEHATCPIVVVRPTAADAERDAGTVGSVSAN